MSIQHSPAPWRGGDHGGGASIEDANGRRIASLAYGKGAVSARIDIDECNVNHRLMIVAPELLDLLSDSLPYVEEAEQFNKPGRRDLSKRIRAALAKAEPGMVPS